MPSFWPFGRNKKKKLVPVAITEEKLHEQHNAGKGQTLTFSGIAKDQHSPNPNLAAQPVDISELDTIETFPLPHDSRHTNGFHGHASHSTATTNTRQSSISSAQNQEPLVEIDDLAGGFYHNDNKYLLNTLSYQQPELGSPSQTQPENTFPSQPLYSIPTLRPKRSAVAAEVLRSKSTKSRSSFRDREKEIRARTSPIPIPIPKRPASFVSGVFSRSSRKIVGDLDRRFTSPESGFSSPMAPSPRTSFSEESGIARSYTVTTFAALSPRPTIRYGQSPRSAALTPKSSKRKDKGRAISENIPPLPNPRSRIKDLANDLDARALREVMERDKRRKDRKKAVDPAKLERKLEQSLKKQKAKEIAAEPIELEGSPIEVGAITPPPQPEVEEETGTITPLPEPEIEEETGRITPVPELETEENKNDRQDVPISPRKAMAPPLWTRTKSTEEAPPVSPLFETSPQQTIEPPPLASRRTTETSIPWQSESRRISSEQISIRDDPIIDTATAVRLSTISMSPPASPTISREPIMNQSLLSHITSTARDSPEPSSYTSAAADIPSIPRKSSQGNVKQGSSWASIFKRAGTKRKVSTDKEKKAVSKTEFSNVSRESFQRKKLPPGAVPVVQRSFQRSGGPLQRKQSKFREHLSDDFVYPATSSPISPPQSRIQSPEPEDRPLSPYLDDTRKLDEFNNDDSMITPIEDVHPALRDRITRSREHSLQGQTMDSALLSQSLASIDSEGSWLSGKPHKRSSVPITESLVSLNQLDESEQPDFARRDIAGNATSGPGGLSSQLRDLRSSPADADTLSRQGKQFPFDADVKYDAVQGHRPNIVQRPSVARSREGLLEEFPAYNDETPVSPISPEEFPESPYSIESSVHRATSVNVRPRGGHARQLTAGSARLLDIPPRSSSDTKRSSVAMSASNTQSPPHSPAEFKTKPDA